MGTLLHSYPRATHSIQITLGRTCYILLIFTAQAMHAVLAWPFNFTIQLQHALTVLFSAWWGFASAIDRQRLEAFIRRSHRCHFLPPNLPSFTELCSTADNKLFQCVINNSKHVLYGLLPPSSVASQNYNLRHRKHSLQLPSKTHHLMDSNFIQCMLYLDSY